MTGGPRAGPPTQQQDLVLRHEHRLTTLALEVLRLLAKPQEDVDRLVADQLEKNPALLAAGPRRCRWCGLSLVDGRCRACGGPVGLMAEPPAAADERDEVRLVARQLAPRGCERAVDVVMAGLDARGLLPGGLAELTPQGCAPAQLAAGLRAVQEAGPPGTAAPDAAAALLAQARWHAAHGGPPLLVPLLGDHLAAFATDRAAAAAALGVGVAEVDAVARFVRARLTPAPLPSGGGPRHPAPPDVILRAQDGEVSAVVLRPDDLGLALAPDGPGRGWQTARAEARSLLDVLDRRAGTLQRLADVLAHRQRGFVLHGPAAHRPLTRAQVAAEVGVHPSTVSRAVAGAVARLPDGRIVALADFFGGAVSARAALAAMLGSPRPPRSDAEAAARLAETGVVLARRTVAKYRRELEEGS